MLIVLRAFHQRREVHIEAISASGFDDETDTILNTCQYTVFKIFDDETDTSLFLYVIILSTILTSFAPALNTRYFDYIPEFEKEQRTVWSTLDISTKAKSSFVFSMSQY